MNFFYLLSYVVNTRMYKMNTSCSVSLSLDIVSYNENECSFKWDRLERQARTYNKHLANSYEAFFCTETYKNHKFILVSTACMHGRNIYNLGQPLWLCKGQSVINTGS